MKVPGPGTLTAKAKSIKRATAKATKAGTVKLRLKLVPSAREKLEKRRKLRVKVAVTFDPVGGRPRTSSVPVIFKLPT